MAVDYDLVIIGGSLAGRYAAACATQLRATVALVEPEGRGQEEDKGTRRQGDKERISPTTYPLPPTKTSPLATYLAPHTLTQIAQLKQQLANAGQFGLHWHHPDANKSCQISVQLTEAMRWAEGVVSNLEDQNSPAVLASLGVDFIQGTGQFEAQPRLAFAVNNRRLLARSYLIATNSRPAIPEIEGLQSTGYLTPAEVWRSLTSPTPSQRWVILGGDPTGYQLAQALVRLGLDVTLVVKRPHILAQEDPEIAQLVQAMLEAEGVRVLTATTVTQVMQIDDKKWLQVGNEAMEFDQILLCAGQQPDVEDLNLEAVGVKLHRRRLLLNEKLQTTNHRIYACGDAIGGYQFAHIANYEAEITLKNALFFPVFKVDYRSIPWAIFSHPQLARVGLTEAQARRRYGRDVLVLRQYFKTVAAAQLQNEITGICKLIVRRNGTILGAAVVGSQAGELINPLALAIAQRVKVDAIANLVTVYPSLSEILSQTAAEYRQAQLINNHTLQNILEGFFHFRRSY
jgi:pyruvate/2-oxoglutarate dehydrogenase complex dihydrolipoamide dehydrogenase (E3) component